VKVQRTKTQDILIKRQTAKLEFRHCMRQHLWAKVITAAHLPQKPEAQYHSQNLAVTSDAT